MFLKKSTYNPNLEILTIKYFKIVIQNQELETVPFAVDYTKNIAFALKNLETLAPLPSWGMCFEIDNSDIIDISHFDLHTTEFVMHQDAFDEFKPYVTLDNKFHYEKYINDICAK